MARQYDGSKIAILGMACHFPGARNVGQFWRHLGAGVGTALPGAPDPRDEERSVLAARGQLWLAGHRNSLLRGLVTRPKSSLASLPMLRPAECHQLPAERSDSATNDDLAAAGAPVAEEVEELDF